MAKVVIYTKPYCPYCVRALALLERKGVDFEEIEAAFDPEKKAEMIQRSNGGRTFPQIFIGETQSAAATNCMRWTHGASWTRFWPPDDPARRPDPDPHARHAGGGAGACRRP